MAQMKIDPKDKEKRLSPIKKLMKKHKSKSAFDAICKEMEEIRDLMKKPQK